MFPKRKYNKDISQNAQYLALFRSPSDRKQIGFIAERMFDKNRVHFMNAYYKETGKPYGYLLVNNKPSTPPDTQTPLLTFYAWKTERRRGCLVTDFQDVIVSLLALVFKKYIAFILLYFGLCQ